MEWRPDMKPRRRPYLWAGWWSLLIGAALCFPVWGISPNLSCKIDRDWGGGAILDRVPEDISLPGHGLSTQLDSAAGFPPQGRCRLLATNAAGPPQVVAEADYPTTKGIVTWLLFSFSPIMGVALWQLTRRFRRKPDGRHELVDLDGPG
jgi:hypothetical protein